MLRRSLVLLLLPLMYAFSTPAAEPFDVEHLVDLARVSDPQVSPDAKWVSFSLRETDREANKGRTDIWVASLDEPGVTRRLTSNPAGDSSARWSSDGTIFFLSTRSGSSQVWKIDPSGGESVQVTDLPLAVSNLVVSPDGERIAFTTGLRTSQTIDERVAETSEAGQSSGVVYDELFVRHWDTWKDGTRSRLFVMELSEDASPVLITSEFDADVPSMPFGGAEEITFTPDSKQIVFTMRDQGPKEPWSTNFDLFVAPVDGSAKPRNLTEANEAWDTQPLFSPDGKWLAYLRMARPGFEADRFRLTLMSWPEGKIREVTDGWDRSPSGFDWSADGKRIFVSAANLGHRSLFEVDVKTKKVRELMHDGYVHALARGGQGPSESVVIAKSSLRSPAELFTVSTKGAVRQLTNVNREMLADVEMGEPEQFTFKGWNGETVHGWMVPPVGFSPDESYPVAFLIHGGPQGSFGNSFHYRWNPQTYAGAGYAAVMIDFHGSTGYGQDFTDSITGDWGGKPLIDLQKGLAYALERYPWMDGDRVAALGASYGGYMVNWIAGLWPDRFDALVNHDGIFDTRMMYYTTEELWFVEWENLGTPWEVPENYERFNPAQFVKSWKTPMLVVHGGLDFRVPETQGLATFTALQRRGIPSRLLYYPDENHWVLSPANSVQWHREVLAWLDRWVE